MTQYGNWSQEYNLEEYKNIYYMYLQDKKGDLEYFICCVHFKNSWENKLRNLLEGNIFLVLKEIIHMNMKEQLIL